MKYTSDSNQDLQERLSDKLEGVAWHSYYYTAICPFHVSFPVRQSLFVYTDGFRCASCNEWGTLKKLEQKLSGIKIRYKDGDEPTEVNEFPNFKGWLTQYKSYQGIASHAYKTTKQYPVLLDYLKKRGLYSIAKSAYIGYIDGWLTFPIFDDSGDFVDLVLRSTPSVHTTSKYVTRPRLYRGEGFQLYSANWGSVSNSSEIYIPFGVLDMHTISMAGLPTATGLTGKAYKAEWFDNIRKRIWLIPDQGEEEDAYKLKAQLGWRAKVLQLNYPSGCKDINDILINKGIDQVILSIQESK